MGHLDIGQSAIITWIGVVGTNCGGVVDPSCGGVVCASSTGVAGTWHKSGVGPSSELAEAVGTYVADVA